MLGLHVPWNLACALLLDWFYIHINMRNGIRDHKRNSMLFALLLVCLLHEKYLATNENGTQTPLTFIHSIFMGERQFVCLWKTVSIVFHAFQLIDCDHIAHIQVRQIPLLPIMIWRLLCALILWFEFIGEILVWWEKSSSNNDVYKRIKCCGKHTMNSMIFRWKITFHNAVSECSSNSIIVEFIQRMAVCAQRRCKIVSCCFFVSSLNYAYVTTVHCIDPTTSTLKQNSLNLHFANNWVN